MSSFNHHHKYFINVKALFLLLLIIGSHGLEIHTSSSLFSLNHKTNQQFLSKELYSEPLIDIPNLYEPYLYTKADLMKVLDKTRESGQVLDPIELSLLYITNENILLKKIPEPLNSNDLHILYIQYKYYQKLQNYIHFPTNEEANGLDGNYNTYMPIELEAKSITINNILNDKTNINDIKLEYVYKRLLNKWALENVEKDVRNIIKAVKGLGTTEELLWKTLENKNLDQINELCKSYDTIKHHHYNKYRKKRCNLQAYIESDLSGGDLKKFHAYWNANKILPNHEYYLWSSISKSWSDFLKDSDKEAKHMLKHGNWLEKSVGWVNQAVFSTAGHINIAVKDAQKFWLEKASKSTGAGKGVAFMMYVFATLGGSMGTKALDPTLPYNEIGEGILDAALILGTLGAGKLVQVAMSTKHGIKLMTTIAKASRKMSQYKFALRNIVKLGPTTEKLTLKAAKYRKLATTTRNPARAAKCTETAQQYELAASRVNQAEQALAKSRKAISEAEWLAANSKNPTKVDQAFKSAAKAKDEAKVALQSVREAEESARTLSRSTGAIRNSKAYELLTKPLFRKAPKVPKQFDARTQLLIDEAIKKGDIRFPREVAHHNPVEFIDLADGRTIVKKVCNLDELQATIKAQKIAQKHGIEIPNVLKFEKSINGKGFGYFEYLKDTKPLDLYIKGLRGVSPPKLLTLPDGVPKVPYSEWEKLMDFTRDMWKHGFTPGDFKNMGANIMLQYDSTKKTYKICMIDFELVVSETKIGSKAFATRMSQDGVSLERLEKALIRNKILEKPLI